MEEQYQKGLDVRRAVLGDEYVDRSLNAITEFNKPMDALTTEWCWGEIWTRPGLDRKTRSIINLSMLTALNRHAELKAHVRGALNNGLTMEEIREVFLQTAIYCGVPAAIESFKIASEVLEEMGRS